MYYNTFKNFLHIKFCKSKEYEITVKVRIKVKGIMKEIESISKAENIRLPDNIVDFSYLMVKNFPYETKTSFQRDFELEDKPDERELFGQTIIDLGVKHGIDTTVAKSVYQELHKRD